MPRNRAGTIVKPTNMGANQLKNQRSLQAVAEERVGRKCRALRMLNSYWVARDSLKQLFEVITVDPFHKTIRRDPSVRRICKPCAMHREMRGLTSGGRKSPGLGKGHTFQKTIGHLFLRQQMGRLRLKLISRREGDGYWLVSHPCHAVSLR